MRECLEAALRAHGGVLQTARLRRIGDGATHTFYKHPSVPDVLLRLARTPHEERGAAASNDVYARFQNALGEWCVPRFSREVPVLEGAVARFAVLTVEPYEKAFHDPLRVPIGSHCVELGPCDPEAYRAVNDSVFGGAPLDPSAWLALDPAIAPCFIALAGDTAFYDLLREFITRAIAFVEQTGELLDLTGTDNVVAVRRGDAWTIRAGAVLKGDHIDAFTTVAAELVEEGPQAVLRFAGDRAALLNGLALWRVLNGYAALLGVTPLAAPVDGLAPALDALRAAAFTEPTQAETRQIL